MTTTPSTAGAVPRPQRHRPPLAAAVVKSLVTAIVVGDYPPGSALPPAGALCEQYEVSRTVIREATTALVEKGLVASRQGWGTIVLDQDQWSLLDPLVLDALFQREDRLVYLDNLIEIRTTLECAMARRAAGLLDAEQRTALTAKLDELADLVDDPTGYARVDVEFHELIHRASRDAFGRAIVSSVQGKALHTPQYSGTPSVEDVRSTHEGHTRILEALVAGDAAGAEAAMRDHITSSWARRRPQEAPGA
ncbi:FadR/GntR family transcriptional regulator [Krasilnikoviella flava]|uniref:DNA-binding transcriptional regulator, FadR family n=1 Tax=Krasilnikoviella flava TaxID=526729 RepID=A0A1T5KSV0_9MICO|nr:FCD domain-containing protein [Krasilnikoviella flava]SKC66761.1 DNA-binding transcriptional regulator, FadR family [Krasilnikoviella flava]